MKKFTHIAVIAGLAFSANGFAANVTGKVNFSGKAPKAKSVRMNADPFCAKQNKGSKPKDEQVVVNDNGTLKNVVVFVSKGAKKSKAATKPIEFDQQNCIYVPHVLAVQTDQPLKIINSDATLHNVHALPKKNKGFNMAMATKGQVIEKTFKKPETGIRVKCDVHGWMSSYVSVFDHPYFAVTGDDGTFTIADLPDGEYTLETWHEKYGKKTATVKVAGGDAKADFTYSVGS